MYVAKIKDIWRLVVHNPAVSLSIIENGGSYLHLQ